MKLLHLIDFALFALCLYSGYGKIKGFWIGDAFYILAACSTAFHLMKFAKQVQRGEYVRRKKN